MTQNHIDDIRLPGRAAIEIRKEIGNARSTVWWFELFALFVMPGLLGLLGNALVSQIYADTPDRLVISTTVVLLLVCTVLQVVFGISALKKPAVVSTIDEAELRTEIATLQDSIQRKDDVHETLRESFDEYNAQVCQLDGWCQSDFQTLLNQVFAPTRATIDKVLGIKNRVFTVEVYLDVTYLRDSKIDMNNLLEEPINRPMLGSTTLAQWYFYASERIAAQQSLSIGDRHPAVMAWGNHVPDEFLIDRHQHLYGTSVQPFGDVYFRRSLSVPIRMVCDSSHYWGVLVVTTMQCEPLADDAIDNLQWLSTLTTNFVAGYNKCKEGKRAQLEYERRSRAQKQRRSRDGSGSAESMGAE
jgi:hypothetical protein